MDVNEAESHVGIEEFQHLLFRYYGLKGSYFTLAFETAKRRDWDFEEKYVYKAPFDDLINQYSGRGREMRIPLPEFKRAHKQLDRMQDDLARLEATLRSSRSSLSSSRVSSLQPNPALM